MDRLNASLEEMVGTFGVHKSNWNQNLEETNERQEGLDFNCQAGFGPTGTVM